MEIVTWEIGRIFLKWAKKELVEIVGIEPSLFHVEGMDLARKKN